MYCYQHPDRDAIGDCVACKEAICPECKVEYGGKVYCNPCIQSMVSGESIAASQPSTVLPMGNTSGMGRMAAVPQELGDWNWGGFLLTWVWGIGNTVWWSFLVFIPYLGIMVMPWVLAFKGNQWAWQSRHWDSVEHFKRVQHTWTMWGMGITIAVTLVLTIMLLLGLGLMIWALQRSGIKTF
jgi:hypothetical protein